MNRFKTDLNPLEFPILHQAKIIPIQKDAFFQDDMLAKSIGTHNAYIENLSYTELTLNDTFNLSDSVCVGNSIHTKRGILQSIVHDNKVIFHGIQRGYKPNIIRFIHTEEQKPRIKQFKNDPYTFLREYLEWEHYEALQITFNLEKISDQT